MFMKILEVIKRPLTQLVVFVFLLLCLPYLAPFMQGGSSEFHSLRVLYPRFLFVTALTAVIAFMAYGIRKKALCIVLTTFFWAAAELLIMNEAFMFCFVGHSFDQSFLLHCNIDTISGEVMKNFWKPVTVTMLLYLAAMAATGFMVSRVKAEKFDRTLLMPLGAALALLLIPSTPLAELAGAIHENRQAEQSARNSSENPDSAQVSPGKNLVFIIVESLEQNYLSQKHFPGLIPNITKWMDSENALVFENLISAPQNTFDFLYQSHTGNYIYSISDSDYADKRFSLTQLLKKAGYNTTFLKSCSLDFASTGTFVKKVKYDRQLDWQVPEIKAQATELGEWGFRDYDLFKIARQEFKKLAAQKKPFCLTLLTVDSHAPNGVIGKNSLSYTLPDGEKFSLLSALHTTDKALGEFLEFIKNSPEGKDTVIVVSGDHLVMKDMVPHGKSVQSMLEYKDRKNLLAFMINGTERGKVAHPCWPVDLPPMILHQMGVTHNAVFPSGINALKENDAPPRQKLSYAQYMARQKQKAVSQTQTATLLKSPASVSGGEKDLTMNIGTLKVKCDPLEEFVGTFMEFHSKNNTPTSYKYFLDRDATKLFNTNMVDYDLFYMLVSHQRNLFHFVLNEYDFKKKFLASIRGGWYRYTLADKFSDLKLTQLATPLPRIKEADIDLSKNIVTLRGNGWSFPLFSKTNTYLPQCFVAAADDSSGRETIMRKNFHLPSEMKDFYNLLDGKISAKGFMTVIAPPDSPLHKRLNIPVEKHDQLLRYHLTPAGAETELIPMRVKGEYFIARNGSGKFRLLKEGSQHGGIVLNGQAPAQEFAQGQCYALTLDPGMGKVLAEKSFSASSIAEKLMLERTPGRQTLLICGKNSEFLKTFYPSLAKYNVLFSITGQSIRHTVQYSNGNFRIPDAAEALDVLGGASAVHAKGLLIVTWGNASFVMPGAEWESTIASGKEIAIKLAHYNPADIIFFTVSDPLWLTDIAKAWKTDFLILGSDKSTFPSKLQQQKPGKFFIALSRAVGWELFGSDRVNFSIPATHFKHQK